MVLNILQVRKNGIADSINHTFDSYSIRIDSYNTLPIEKNVGFS